MIRPLDHLPLRGDPNAPALVLGEASLNYDDLERETGRLAKWLTGRGFPPGARVASWLLKDRWAALLPLATVRAGLVHVPINPALRRAQAAHILADSGASLLLANAGRLASLEPGDAACPVVDVATLDLAALDPLPPSTDDPQALAALLYTSGSTGRPKGVMLTSANLWLGADAVAAYLGLAPDDRTLAVLPLSFDYGQNQLLSAWMAGSAVVALDYLAPRDVVAAVERHGITTLAGVPPLWVQLAEAAWPDAARAPLRRLTNSGGAMPRPLFDRLRALFPSADIHLMYGLTEAFRSTSLPPDLADTHAWSIGRAVPHAEVMVVRPDGTATEDGEPGELVHAGPLVAAGYWNDPARTAARFRPAPAHARSGGTAVWSGDTVVPEADGMLRFVGREDEMIKTAGNRVSPGEIEDAALGVPGVHEAAAFGVPDPRLDQRIHLFARADDAARDALPRHLKRELPAWMQPAVIDWQDALPRSPNGKIDRAALRAMLTS